MRPDVDPLAVRAATMDLGQLKQLIAERKEQARPLRIQFWRLWLRNKLVWFAVLAFYALIAFGAVDLWLSATRGFSDWSLWVAVLIFVLVIWLLGTHTPMNTFLERWENEENDARVTLKEHLYTLSMIRTRYKLRKGKSTE